MAKADASENASKLSVDTDHAEVAAYFVAFQAEDQSKWVFSGNVRNIDQWIMTRS